MKTHADKIYNLLKDGKPHRAVELVNLVGWSFTKPVSLVRDRLPKGYVIPENVLFNGTGVYMIIKETKVDKFKQKVRLRNKLKKRWDPKEVMV